MIRPAKGRASRADPKGPGVSLRKGGRARRRIVIGLVGFVGLCLVAGLGVFGYTEWRLGQVQKVSVGSLTLRASGDATNVLVVGSDSRAGLTPSQQTHFGNTQNAAGQRSDVILILRVNTSSKKASILSVPRDLYVSIGATGTRDRINSAFNNGPNQLVQTIQNDLGIPINHYAGVNFDGFQGLVDAVGGINMYFPYPAKDIMSGLNITQSGCIALNGASALALARSRDYQYLQNGSWPHDGSGDLGRIQRQHTFLRVLMQKAITSGTHNPLTANAVVSKAVHDVTIDNGFGLLEIFRLFLAARSLQASQTPTYTIPTTPTVVNGSDVLLLQQPQAQQVIGEFMAATQATASPGNQPGISPSNIRARVLNGSGLPGQATRAAKELRGAGFLLTGTGDAGSFSYGQSVVLYSPGMQAKAQFLQAYVVGGARLQQDGSLGGADVGLVTGASFAGIQAPSSPTSSPSPVAIPSYDPRAC